MKLFTIMILDVDHIDEICEDIKMQYEKGIANCVLFMMTLVPEGNPPEDKVSKLCKKYDMFRERLSKLGVPNGVLVQATIGHGYALSEKFPYQSYIQINSGNEENTVCPYDEGFREYIYNVMKTIAEHKPDHIMVDDDFRLIYRAGGGCGCPLHMKRFNELSNTQMTRKELADAILLNNEKSKEYFDIFAQTQSESLVECAKVMREAIDSVDPKIPGSFCCVGGNAENGAEVASVLAGEGNPVIVRIDNSRCTAPGPRGLSDAFFRASVQMEKLKDKVDVIIAETDTCPQNRYSTSASMLHAHFTGSILEGAKGAKHWITRLCGYEPESGYAYRKTLAKYSKFYEELSKIVPHLSWRGCRIPVSSKAEYAPIPLGWNSGIDMTNGWGSCVLERFGVPMYFSGENGGVLCLEGEVDKMLDDDSIKEALKGSVFLASDAAENLIKRGFGKYIGVTVKEHCGKSPTVEKINATGQFVEKQMKFKELVKTNSDTVSLSSVYHTVDRENYEYLFPGVTMYKNEFGGTVFTFCGTPNTAYNIIEAFSFLNYSRKEQIISMLKETGELPLYYPNDEEVYLKVADTNDNRLFCAVFNLGLDNIENTELIISKDVSDIKMLMPDGSYKDVAFERDGDKYILDANCHVLDPLILLIK